MSIGVAALDESYKEFFTRLAEIAGVLDMQAFDDAERICQSLLALGAQHATEEGAFAAALFVQPASETERALEPSGLPT